TPFFDELAGACVAQCSAGQKGDPVLGMCMCPVGTFMDFFSKTCVEAQSDTICPPGTAGIGCDFMKYSMDCDGDGIINGDEQNDPMLDPCINEDGVNADGAMYCPADTGAMTDCNLMDMTMDCDGDGAANDYDPCPCKWGSSMDDFCPAGIKDCPEGLYLDEFYEGCFDTCPEPRTPSPEGVCMCPPGTFLDWNSGSCSSDCPPGMDQGANGECICGSANPYFDPMIGMCAPQCSGGQIPDPVYGDSCMCPMGSGPDFSMGMCVCPDGTMPNPATNECPVSDQCDSTAAGNPINCACTTDSQCADGLFCDFAAMVCAPIPTNCDNNQICDIDKGESYQSCPSDCWCGDNLCDGYEINTFSCPSDCGDPTAGGEECPNGCDFVNKPDGNCDGDTMINREDTCPCEPGGANSYDGCPSCSWTMEPCNAAGDCCSPNDTCLLDPAMNMMVCKQEGSGTLCNNDGACEPWNGENHDNCMVDCKCNMDSVCDYPDEEEGWCADCGGAVCGDGRCQFDLGGEDRYNCKEDCVCDMDGICEPTMNEAAGWCPDDCSCKPDGAGALGPADCCDYFDACTGVCTSSPPNDTDYDGQPDTCDNCPQDPGPKFNEGCPTGCQTDADCMMDSAGAAQFCDTCSFTCVATPMTNSDNDMLPDACDDCPLEAGMFEFNGCPGDMGFCQGPQDCYNNEYCDLNIGECQPCDPSILGDTICCGGEDFSSTDC
ncbi:hypothetical protein ACFLQK_03020, partial [bacterium]